jgi:hypothetical protein
MKAEKQIKTYAKSGDVQSAKVRVCGPQLPQLRHKSTFSHLKTFLAP